MAEETEKDLHDQLHEIHDRPRGVVVHGIPRSATYIRDTLAADRTILANERTFLSFIRTALTLFIAGVTFIKFFESDVLLWIGWLFIPVSGIIFIAGIFSYRKTRRTMLDDMCAEDHSHDIDK